MTSIINIAKVTVETESGNTSFKCGVGIDSFGHLIIRSINPITKTRFYEKYKNDMDHTGSEIEIFYNKSFDSFMDNMINSIHEILNELQDIPRISVKETNESDLIDKDMTNKQQTNWEICIGGIPCKDIKIHWMKNYDVIDWVYCNDNDVTIAHFKYKGTDDNKNVYLSNDLINWYRKMEYNNEDIINNINDNLKNMTDNINKSDTHKEMKNETDDEKNIKSNNMNEPQIKDEVVEDPQKDPFEEMNTDVTQVEPKLPVNLKDAVHVFLKWMIQQDPINPNKHRPVHYKIICELIQKLSEQFLAISKCMFGDYYYFEVTEKELKNLIHGLIFDNPATKDHFAALNITYNEAKNGCTIKDRYEDTEPKVTFCSRYSGPAWQNDFIDLDALCNNVTRELIKISIPTAE